jgi:hypothetical protein
VARRKGGVTIIPLGRSTSSETAHPRHSHREQGWLRNGCNALNRLEKQIGGGRGHERAVGWSITPMPTAELVFRHTCMMGLEGIVSKRLSKPGRSEHSLKLKNPGQRRW